MPSHVRRTSCSWGSRQAGTLLDDRTGDPGAVTEAAARSALARAHEAEWARVVASLARRFGDLDVAEDAAADAFAVAAERWPAGGVPPDPAGPVEDDRLRLMFTCCHPVLPMNARVALTLRLIGGLTVAEIAAAFLVRESAMSRRITRAKARINESGTPYRLPTASDVQERLPGVLAVVYLVFNEGYLATSGERSLRTDLSDEAIRLGRVLHELLPREGEVSGLLAMMLLIDARRRARLSEAGGLVLLTEQDRSCWDRTQIAEGHALVRERIAATAAEGMRPGRYQLLAAINAVHTDACRAQDTDWAQIVALYDQLVLLDPSPVVRLNRAVAIGEIEGPDVALLRVDELADALEGYDPFHATRGELLRRLGDSAAARLAYERAIALASNPAERAHLQARLDAD